MAAIDWNAVRTATQVGIIPLFALAVALGFAVDESSPTVAATYLVVALISFLLAGAVAGGLRPDVPVANGVVASVIIASIAQVVGVTSALASGARVAWLMIPATLVLAAACGAGGALWSEWRLRRGRRARSH